MPSISLDLTITKNYPKATHAPVEVKAAVAPGKIKSITLQFPAGCQYQAKVQVNISTDENTHMPLLPTPSGGYDNLDYIALDDFVQEFPVNFKLEHYAVLYAWGWNEDTVNDHEVKVIVNLE